MAAKIAVHWPLDPLDLSTVNTISQTYEGKDKMLRAVQFGARALYGLFARSRTKGGRRIAAQARRLMIGFAASRRAFRWGRELPVLLNLPNSFRLANWQDRCLSLAQQVSMLLFFEIDHVGSIKQMSGGMRNGAQTIQLGLKFLTLSASLLALMGLRALLKLRAENDDVSGSDNTNEQRQYMLGIFRNTLMAFQVAHVSRLKETSDFAVGSLGVVSSCIDLLPVWPHSRAQVSASCSKAHRKSCPSLFSRQVTPDGLSRQVTPDG